MKTILLRLEVVLVLTAALGALLFHGLHSAKTPPDEDYQAVANVLAKEAQPRDALLLHPWWAEKARLFVPPTIPVVGFLGVEQADFIEFERVWVLSSGETPYTPPHLFSSLPPLGPTREFGNLSLTLYRTGEAQKLLFHAATSWKEAEAHLELADGTPQPCMKTQNGFRCPQGASVTLEWHEVAFQPRRCLFVRPPSNQAKLVVNFPNVPTDGQALLSAGYIWDRGFLNRNQSGDLVANLQNEQGQELVSLSLPPGTAKRVTVRATGSTQQTSARLILQSPQVDLRESCIELMFLERHSSHL